MKYIVIILTIAVGAVLIINFAPIGSSKKTLTADEMRLIRIGDRCAEIADKSVADKVAIVEFQKLEIASRRYQVISDCMHDNGYKQNPQWLRYATPLARINAEKQKISFNEAITTMGNTDMQQFSPNKNQPSYWMGNKIN